jgi:N-methylhydantoinase B
VTAPEGCLVNPRRPASTVSGLTETCNRLIDMVIAALSPGIPDRVCAGELGSCNVYTLGGQRSDGEQWVAILNPKGGWGGMDAKDGWTCIQDPLSNCRSQPAESLENAFPMIVRTFSLRTGGEGAGRRRGGFGITRDIEVTENCVISTCLDRSAIAPFGLFGGDDGAPNVMHVKRKGSDTWEPLSSRQSNMALAAGDVVRIETAIGGGFGDPFDRDPEAVAADVADEYLPSAEAAREIYGVVLRDDLSVDQEATSRLRQERRDHEPRTALTDRVPTFQPA